MADLPTGSTFAGHRIDGAAGRGGMGIVFRATDLRLERSVALKLISGELAKDEGFAARFVRESRVAASIDHPNVIPIYHAGEEDGRLYLTMRFVEGTDLGAVLAHDRRLDPERAVRILAQVAAALDAAHARGLVHRDVKPGNVLIEQRADGDHVFLTDFGLTKHAHSESALTETGTLLGTVDYVAPEQIEGGEVDGRADVYALGCVLFEMLTGRIPFDKPSQMAKLFAHVHEEPPSAAGQGVSEELAAVVRRAMEKEPGRRFQSAGGFARAAADSIGASLPSTATAAPVSTPLSARPRRRPPRAALVGGAAAAAAAVVAVILLASSGGGSGGGSSSSSKPDGAAIMAVLGRVHQGITVGLCRNDLTADFLARFFAPRRGREALNTCLNTAGGGSNRKPLVVEKLRIQGDTASARIDFEDEVTTFFLVKRGRRWLVDDFTETAGARYTRQISTLIEPPFRITPELNAFVTAQLPLEQANGVPEKATAFLRTATPQIEGVQAPAGVRDIHRRLVAAMQAQLAAAEDAVAAQKAHDAKAFTRAEHRIFGAIQALGGALDDLSRAQ